ncbi:Pnt1 [Kluyveromyces lactis]|nr:Pnt1 [Kluyveromyces lactis]
MTVANRVGYIVKRGYTTQRTPIDISSNSAFKESLASNALLNRLYQLNQNGKVAIKVYSDKCPETNLNVSATLPVTHIPTAKITDAVKGDESIANWRKPLVKWFRLGKFVFGMYKVGVKSTWSTYFDSKGFKYTVNELTKLIEFKEIESRVLKQNKFDEIDITRKQYLQWLRRKEFWKIPRFLIALIMFEEVTLLLCYLFPSLSPWNCLMPGLYRRISDSRSKKLVENFDAEKSYISPYDLDKAAVSQFLTKQKMMPSWRMGIYNISKEFKIPLLKVVETNQKITIDDWLLLRELLRDSEERIIISDRELVDAIARRQLYQRGEDLNKMVQDIEQQKVLKLRLLLYLSFKFEGTVTADIFDGKLLAEIWGVNNMAIFNFPGSNELLKAEHLKNIGL